MNGILLVDKPSGWTSFDAVAKVRGIIRTANRQTMASQTESTALNLPKRVKVGHTGTLDPLATGLLVLLIGSYTKRAPELTKFDKTYEVTMKLGETSTTGDEEGEKTVYQRPSGVSDPTNEALEQALKKFTGDIMQTPPIFSAMKVGGVRAYKLAREGKAVALEPRPAKVYLIRLTEYSYPSVKFIAEVSSGTYIRSLVEDVGRELDTGAYMSGLRRTCVGTYDIENALPADALDIVMIRASLKQLASSGVE